MKRIITISLLFLAVIFTSCYDAIFQSIRDEIVLQDGVINGQINSMVRYADAGGNEYLFVQNGKLYNKKISDGSGGYTRNDSHDSWDHVGTPGGSLSYDYHGQKFDGRYICRVAADADYVYILTVKPRYDEDSSRNVFSDFVLYYRKYPSGDWEKHSLNSKIDSYLDLLDEDNYMMDCSIQLFCTNAPKKDHRKAYIRIGGGDPYEEDTSEHQAHSDAGAVDANHCAIFELNGSGATAVAAGTGKLTSGGADIAGTGTGKYTTSCAYFNSGVIFMDHIGICTNETYAADPTHLYYGDGKKLHYHDGTTDTELTKVDDNILSICVCKDVIYLGTDESGAYKGKINAGVPSDISDDNDGTKFASQMCEPYVVTMLLCVDPSLTEADNRNSFYSALQFYYTANNASANYDNVGLWAYYPRKNGWNKE